MLGHFAVCLLAMSQWEKHSKSNKIITGLEAELVLPFLSECLSQVLMLPRACLFCKLSHTLLDDITYGAINSV